MTQETKPITPQETKPITLKEKVSNNIYYASVYFITVGAVYLWGYWPNFNVNILEYIAVTDVLKFTAFPIAATAVSLVFSSVVGEFYFQNLKLEKRLDGTLSKISPARVPAFLTFISIFKQCYFVVTVLIAASRWDNKWLVLPPLLSLPMCLLAYRHGILQSQLPNSNVRWLALYLLSILPFSSYANGVHAAKELKQGSEYSYVISNSGDQLPRKDDAKKLRYIGHAGDSVFLYDPLEDSTLILKANSDKPLVIKNHPRKIEESNLMDKIKKLSSKYF